jgi:hypothetical protein
LIHTPAPPASFTAFLNWLASSWREDSLSGLGGVIRLQALAPKIKSRRIGRRTTEFEI